MLFLGGCISDVRFGPTLRSVVAEEFAGESVESPRERY